MSSADNQPSLIISTVSRTETKAGFRQANHLWIIDNFRRIHVDRGVKLYSTPFSAADIFQWKLQLDPKGRSSKYSDDYCGGGGDSSYISLGFEMIENYTIDLWHFPVTGKFKVSIINAEKRAAITKIMNFTYHSLRSTDTTFSKFVTKDYLFAAKNQLLPDDRLTISCEIIYIKQSDLVHTSGESFSFSPSLEDHQPTGLEDFKKLFRDEKYTDVTLLVNGKDYRAHKAILAARSPVFDAMLGTDMIESRTNQIIINDIDKSVFIEMLRYIYTGKPQNLKKTVIGLLEAADKYDLQQLKVICVKWLIRKLSKDNVKDTLKLADKYNSEDLKTAAIQFSKVNFFDNHVTNESSEAIRENLTSETLHTLGFIMDSIYKFLIWPLIVYILVDAAVYFTFTN